jgi:hypothetical protein
MNVGRKKYPFVFKLEVMKPTKEKGTDNRREGERTRARVVRLVQYMSTTAPRLLASTPTMEPPHSAKAWPLPPFEAAATRRVQANDADSSITRWGIGNQEKNLAIHPILGSDATDLKVYAISSTRPDEIASHLLNGGHTTN